PEMQRAGIRQWCLMNDVPLPTFEYFDASSGRETTRRAGLQQALADSAEYDALLVFHSSRSFRNREDAALWKARFRRAGLTLVYTQQSIISGNPHSKLLEGVHEILDEQRSDEAGMMIAGGLRARYERGLHNGTVPLGYRRYHGAPSDPMNGYL